MEEKAAANPILHQWKDGILTTQDDKIYYYDFKSSKLESEFQHTCPISFVTTNENTNFVVLGYEKKMTVYEVQNKEWKFIFESFTKRNLTCLTFNIDGTELYYGDKSGDVHCIKISSSMDSKTEPIYKLGHMTFVTGICFSMDGKYLISSDSDEIIRVSILPDCNEIESMLMGHSGCISKLSMLNDKTLASGGIDETVKLWNFETPELSFFSTEKLNGIVRDIKKGKLGDDLIISVTFESSNHLELFTFDGKKLKSIETLTFNDNIVQSLLYQDLLFVLTIDSPHLHTYQLDRSNLKITEYKSDLL
eukprot:gene5212-8824_t